MQTILVVDDERVQLKTLRRGLTINGYRVIEAISGREALDQYNWNKQIDLILTDYSMPEMDGLDLLRKIREKNKTMPIVLMSAYGNKDLAKEAMHDHCNAFIDKPFDMKELLSVIKNVLV